MVVFSMKAHGEQRLSRSQVLCPHRMAAAIERSSGAECDQQKPCSFEMRSVGSLTEAE